MAADQPVGPAADEPPPASDPPDSDAALARRTQMLATEHWGLLAVRSQTWSEVMGRITSQLMFTSATLLFLASEDAAAITGACIPVTGRV